jgi:hypothetical protein
MEGIGQTANLLGPLIKVQKQFETLHTFATSSAHECRNNHDIKVEGWEDSIWKFWLCLNKRSWRSGAGSSSASRSGLRHPPLTASVDDARHVYLRSVSRSQSDDLTVLTIETVLVLWQTCVQPLKTPKVQLLQDQQPYV